MPPRTDDLWLESCSFDIMLQLLYVSYGKMLQRVSGDNNKADDDVSIFASVGNEKWRDETVAGKCSTVLSLISICVSVLQFVTTVEHSETFTTLLSKLYH